MKLTELKPAKGSRRKSKNLGRGRASGHGKTCCRGNNGQGQRSGKGARAGFEGGQTPLYRRLPKFQTNEVPNQRNWTIVNLSDLEVLSKCKEITPQILLDKGIIDKLNDGVRVLGDGDIKFAVSVKANYFSKSAKEKIEAAGGKCELITNTKSLV
ncbi:MAG: 50S ribosomal protein L15 [Candidatus Melainabacteria bacterium RIFCSPHIGHO2_02_FULL_34_12]|nr:MAG: 50S ribosomal protein L15 [Candidatus Melainabacteria bacterium RIFCSPHIGHO2_02_FULL_34_12]